ncbi:MAG: hypothetical protein U0271_11300 [Polyangiaceae bacterium]
MERGRPRACAGWGLILYTAVSATVDCGDRSAADPAPTSASPQTPTDAGGSLTLEPKHPVKVGPLEFTFEGCGHTIEEGGHRVFADVSVKLGSDRGGHEVRASDFSKNQEDFGVTWRVVSGCRGLHDEGPLLIEVDLPRAAADCAPLCGPSGRCVVDGGRCVAGSEADCAASEGCKARGLCALRAGACVVGSEADCAASEACVKGGYCALRGDHCGPGTDADCRRSPECSHQGKCALVGDRCRATRDEDCRAATACREEGACSLQRDPLAGEGCVPASDEDCARTPACAEDHRCFKGRYGCERRGNH